MLHSKNRYSDKSFVFNSINIDNNTENFIALSSESLKFKFIRQLTNWRFSSLYAHVCITIYNDNDVQSYLNKNTVKHYYYRLQ